MKKVLAAVVLAGLLGCGSSAQKTTWLGAGALADGTYTPAAYVAKAEAGAGDLLKLFAGAGVSAVWPKDKSLENTYMLDITAQIDLVAGLAAEVSLGWKTYDYTISGGVTDTGELTIKPLYATALYYMGQGGLKAFIGGGLQWDIADIDSISKTVTEEDNVGFHLAGGVSIAQGRFCFQAEARYTFTDITFDYALPDPDVEVEGDELLARVKFLINF